MLMNPIRIATRKSRLAVLQAEVVAALLKKKYQGISVELIKIQTQGDIIQSQLANFGGKGLFVKELETALLEYRADIAVHSMKDVPSELPPGLCLPVILQREDPRDAFVSRSNLLLEELPAGSNIGTSSLRRQCQIIARYPLLKLYNLRGNIDSRLSKLDNKECDAVILAVAGLKRLGLDNRITMILEPAIILPAIGQGAIGIECRLDDIQTIELVNPLNDITTYTQVTIERSFSAYFGANCRAPIAGYATIEGSNVLLRGLVGDPNRGIIIYGEIQGKIDENKIGVHLAEMLIARGAKRILMNY